MEGKYVVIEGHDGTGKSTQASLLRDHLESAGHTAHVVEEPGGTDIGHELRKIIKNGELERDAETNLLMFTASRRDLWQKVIEPALERGEWVIAARNYYSTLAYQCHGEGLDEATVLETTAKFTSERYMQPDFSCILAVESLATARQRIGGRGKDSARDTFESKDESFQDRVQAGYLKIADELQIPVVDASQTIEKVHNDITQFLRL